MKITWSDQQSLAQQISGLNDQTSLIKFKRDMNIGASKFLAALGREYNRHSRTTNLVANQQYYQIPQDAFKLKELYVNTGSYNPPMEQIPDEMAWGMMNMLNITGRPTHYFIRGNNEFGLYPTPANDVTDGITLVFSPKHVQLSIDDFTTGTISIAQNTTTLTHSATGFLPNMVGQWFQNIDGTDENFYKVKSYTSSSVLVLENYYQGLSASGSAFRIGQVMDLPEEFLEGPVDYAMYRHYLKRGSENRAGEFLALFQGAIDQAKDEYGNTTESQVISAEPRFRVYNPWRGDPPASITG